MANLTNLFEKYAAKRMQIKRYAAENGLKISISFVIKLAANIISMYAAYTYVHHVISRYVPAAVFISILALLIIETLSNAFLFHGYKYAFRARYSKAVFEFAIFAAIFSLSVFTSSQGVRVAEIDKVQPEIYADSMIRFAILELEAEAARQVTSYENQIQLVRGNPTLWLNGTLSGLTESQQTEILQLSHKKDSVQNAVYAAVQGINAGRGAYIAQAQKTAIQASTEGVNIIYFALIAQLVTTLYIVFAYYKSTTENDLTDFIESDIENDAKGLVGNVVDAFYSMYSDINNAFLQATQNAKANALMIVSEKKESDTGEAPTGEKETKPASGKRIGFQFSELKTVNQERNGTEKNEPERKNGTDTVLYGNRSKTVTERERTGTKIRECGYCEKEFKYSHHNAKYCCDKCRKDAWKERTGKKLFFKNEGR